MEELLQSIGGPRTLVFAAVVVATALVLKKLLSPAKQDAHTVRRECSCGWAGSVSRYVARCPKCGREL